MSLHVDLMKNEWTTGELKLIKRTDPDDPTIGAQVRSGWATYIHMSEPHTMADCPYAQ